jgi:hypothetical protein
MARPRQDGLKYFSFDTDFFYADSRIKRLRSLYGNDGLMVYIYLLTEIYRNGYFAEWTDDLRENCVADLSLTDGFIEQVMTYLFGRSLLTEIKISSRAEDVADLDLGISIGSRAEDVADLLPIPVTIITSPGIQRRYMEAVKSLRRDVEVSSEIWLLDEKETATYIKCTQKSSLYSKNRDKYGKNYSKSGKNPTKEKKLNKKKLNENKLNEIKTKEKTPTAHGAVSYFDDSELNSLFVDFMRMRKAKKKPMTELAIKRAINAITKLATNNRGEFDTGLARQIVIQSTDHAWDGFYPLKDYNGNRKESVGTEGEWMEACKSLMRQKF